MVSLSFLSAFSSSIAALVNHTSRLGCDIRRLMFGCGPILLVMLTATPVLAIEALVNKRAIVFDHLTTEQGLSQNGVTAFVQDHQGLIWIGTQEGLNRYDGYEFTNFYHLIEDPNSLSHDQVWSLLVDQTGGIWIGTDAGLDRFNPVTQGFERLVLRPSLETNSAAISVYALAEGISGVIWVGTNLGLVQIRPDGTTTWLGHNLNNPNSIGAGSVRALYRDQADRLWVGTDSGGITVIDSQGQVRERYLSDPLNPNSLSENAVRAIQSDTLGRLWVGTYSEGVSVFDERDNRWFRFRHDPKDSNSITGNRIRTILKDTGGDLWIGADGGLNLWRSGGEGFQQFRSDLSNSKSLSDNTILSLFQDQGGVIWVGTFNGISKWNATVEKFPVFKLQATVGDEVSSPSISSFAEDESGNLWIGTFEGLSVWAPNESDPVFFNAESIGLSGRRVMALAVVGDELWAGTMIGGLNVVKDGRVDRVYRFDPEDPRSLSSSAVSRIYLDSKGRQWIATYGGGINLFEPGRGFKRFPSLSNPKGQFSDLRTLDIIETRTGLLWVATDGGGITVLDSVTGDTSALLHDPSDSASLSSNNIVALLETDQGIWVGTRDRGINFYDPVSATFSRYSKTDGLASDAVFGLLEDAAGRIWVSGGKGLTMIDPITMGFQSFDSSHGLQNTDFNSGAYLALTEGLFIFGGNNGFNVFDPIKIRTKNNYVPEITLTQFSKFNQVKLHSRALYEMDQLVLDYQDSVIGFEFVALDFTAPLKNQFRYRLKGFDSDWVELAGEHQTTYTNLDPGDYEFEVIGSNNDLVWNDRGASIRITVLPPPWATWWAYLGYLTALIVAVLLLLKNNTRRQRFEAEKRYSQRLQLYIESLEQATECIIIANAKHEILFANHAIEAVHGLTPTGAVGQDVVTALINDAAQRGVVIRALDNTGRFEGEIAGPPTAPDRTTEVTIARVQDSILSESALVSISRDITHRKQTEAELTDYRKNLESLVAERSVALQREISEHKEARSELASSLMEKELLLKEVHHRVKNNMQVISSLLNMQADAQDDVVLVSLLGESQQRIKSMSLIHESLYQSDNLLEINFEDYIRTLATGLCRFYSIPGVEVQLEVLVDQVALELDTAVPCGLIINELISNALKHGFKAGQARAAVIDVQFVKDRDWYRLKISDNGCGLPQDFDPKQSGSMGMEIVDILTQQLEGRLSFQSMDGAQFIIEFPAVERKPHE